jgi:holin-like protein
LKYMLQLTLILVVSGVGEILARVLPLPVPASVYGLVLLLVLLLTGVVKLHQVRETAHFLIGIMALFFVPITVGIMDSWGDLRPVLVPVLVICLVSTAVTIGSTGTVTQFLVRRKEASRERTAD